MSAHVEGAASEGRTLVGADTIAAAVGVPQSVFPYLEARLPGVRAVRDGTGERAYRAADALLLAGIADLLYRDGQTFRDAAEALRSDRDGVLARGRDLLGIAPARRAVPPRAIPPDAVVGTGGEAPRPRSPRPPSPDVAAVLSDLIDCVRVLEAARGGAVA